MAAYVIALAAAEMYSAAYAAAVTKVKKAKTAHKILETALL